MKKSLKFCIFITCLIFLLVPFSGCRYKGYSGNRKDLYTVAINSILWNNGYSFSTDRLKDSDIEVLEADEYGRTLFSYRERYYAGSELSFSALIVSQASVEGYVYYYEDLNYIIKKQEAYNQKLQDFSEEEKLNIKSLNDWGTAVNFQKCVKKQISKNKAAVPEDGKDINEKVIAQFIPEDKTYNIVINYLTSDALNNFVAYGVIKLHDSESIFFAALIKSTDNSISWFVPSDLYNYQDEFRDFKNENGWSN